MIWQCFQLHKKFTHKMDKIEIEISVQDRTSHIDVLNSHFSKILNRSSKTKYEHAKVADTISQESQSIHDLFT